MSNNHFYRKSENQVLEDVILEARKHAQGNATSFLFRVEQAEFEGTEEKRGRVIQYELTVRPDPKAPEENHPYIRYTIDAHTRPEEFPIAIRRVIHAVERYWQDKSDSELTTQLTSEAINLLMLFKERRHVRLSDALEAMTRLELQAYGVNEPANSEPTVLINDARLEFLAARGLIHVEKFYSLPVAFITGDGMRIASRLEPKVTMNNPNPARRKLDNG